MGLTAMVNLVLNEMQDQRSDVFVDWAFSAVGRDPAGQYLGRDVPAERNEARICLCLKPGEFSRFADLLAIIDGPAPAAALQRIEIIEIDLVDMIQRSRERREKSLVWVP